MNEFEDQLDLQITRRNFLKGLASSLALAALWPGRLFAETSKLESKQELITKPIPSTGEEIPVIGMGTWQTFNVGEDPKLLNQRTKVLGAFINAGGGLIDSSPMYGSSQATVGYGLNKLDARNRIFSADKVWTWDSARTRAQIKASRKHWNLDSFDLMQVHNLVQWEAHLPKLRELKQTGDLKYIGITTSHGRRHDLFERVMKSEPLDFVQLTYNMVDRAAEQRLLPLARERNIAVIANRPFRGGSLVDRVQSNNYPLPEWAAEIDCANWPQFLLKFIVSHPAVTCAIPATTRVQHMRENMGAAQGRLPDSKLRRRMLRYLRSL